MAELRTYRRKRDFTKTAEPEGTKPDEAEEKGPAEAAGAQRLSGGLFCIQKHAASRLHHDLRLELDGVLVSWAVPKGPSLDPKVRRLAVHVEDHPIEYGGFEGTIPKGEYGGGAVMLWDTGSWEPVGDARHGLEKGELKFRVAGERMKGGWVLIHTRGMGDGDENQWLLIKERDEEARPGEPDPWGPDDRSVSTGRTMDEIAAGQRPDRAAGAPAPPVPSTVPLTLATLVAETPETGDWLHEIKYDGYRIAARIDRGGVHLLSRNGWTGRAGSPASRRRSAPPDLRHLAGRRGGGLRRARRERLRRPAGRAGEGAPRGRRLRRLRPPLRRRRGPARAAADRAQATPGAAARARRPRPARRGALRRPHRGARRRRLRGGLPAGPRGPGVQARRRRLLRAGARVRG